MITKNKTKNKKGLVIGIDGGGTKTFAALADLEGRIILSGISGSANPRNIGVKKTAENVAKAIKVVTKNIDKKFDILSVFIGLPAVQEEFKTRKQEIKNEILKQNGISVISKSRITIDSDQIVAFRSGTDEKDGILIIAGTGHVTHGWRKNKEAHVNGWGWLADEGSAFWTGHKALQEVFKDLDGRGRKTLITKLISQRFSLESRGENLLSKIYSTDFVEIISSFSTLVDEADKKNDKIAKTILIEAAKELALSVKTVVDKLNFKKEKFPLVLVGGMFKSDSLLKRFKKEVKKFAPKVNFIRPEKKPISGAVKLAKEKIYDNKKT